MSLVVSNNRFFLSYCTNCLVSYCASWRLFVDLLQRVVGDYYTQGTLSLELFLLFFILEEGFCMSSNVAHLFKEEDLKDCIQGEKCLANGDIYIGSCHGSLPEGLGKYLWADGCMYEGQWSKGQKIGKGKVSWPSGSTYEGEFVGGCLNGYGTFTGVDGSTYKGQWLSNQMHGYGHKFYQNGDVYEGYWKYGIPEGKGRYMWVNGNEYSGYWKSGSISGKGVLRWSNGDKYEGFWIDGLEHGHGIYRWADGSCYVGTWNRGLKDGKGVFYPPQLYPNTGGFGFNLSPSPNWSDREDGMRDRWVSTDFDLTLSNQSSNTTPSKASEMISATYSFNTDKCSSTDSVDSSCVTESDDFEECCSGDGADDATLFTVMEREYAQGVLVSEVSKETYRMKLQRRQKRNKNEKKRPGEIIFKGHRNYDLMLNLQLGIRYTVGRITPEPKRDIVSSDFGPKARIWMRFPPEGTTATPTHQSVEFKWKDYCPMVFRNLRELFKLDAADYMMSICGSDVLRELSSPGKSGSVFYLSHDDRFMIKTMKKSEVKALLRMLPNYYDHIRTYPNTLITRFFGLHAVKPVGCQKVRLVVMHNMFCSDLCIHRRFDLKGSSQGRSTNNSEIDETTTLKDLDLDFVFHLQPSWRGELMKQIDQDCKFLESEKIMDYSLLLGIHLKAPQGSSVVSPASSSNLNFTSSNDSTVEDDNQSKRSIMSPEHESVSDNSLTRYKSEINSPSKSDFSGNSRLQIRLGVNMPARATRMLRRSEHDLHPERELFPEDYDAILYFGIIDILQEYDISKKLEHAYKSFQFDALSISAVDPKQYSKRFRDFMTRIFP